MIIEFQISASAFLAAQKATLESAKFCTPPMIQVGTIPAVIDQIEYGLGSLRHNLPASYSIDHPYLGDVGTVSVVALRTQIAQPVTVYVASLDDMLLHTSAPPSAIVAVSGTVVMDMQLGQAVRVSALVVPGAARDLSIVHEAAHGFAAIGRM